MGSSIDGLWKHEVWIINKKSQNRQQIRLMPGILKRKVKSRWRRDRYGLSNVFFMNLTFFMKDKIKTKIPEGHKKEEKQENMSSAGKWVKFQFQISVNLFHTSKIKWWSDSRVEWQTIQMRNRGERRIPFETTEMIPPRSAG